MGITFLLTEIIKKYSSEKAPGVLLGVEPLHICCWHCVKCKNYTPKERSDFPSRQWFALCSHRAVKSVLEQQQWPWHRPAEMHRPWAARDTREFLQHGWGSGKGLEDKPGHLPQLSFLHSAVLGLFNFSLANHSSLKGSHSAGNSALINLYFRNANHNMSEKINLTNLMQVLIQIIHQTWAVQLYGVHGLRTIRFALGKWTWCWDEIRVKGSIRKCEHGCVRCDNCQALPKGTAGRGWQKSLFTSKRYKVENRNLVVSLWHNFSPSWDIKNHLPFCFLTATKGLLSGPLPCHLY